MSFVRKKYEAFQERDKIERIATTYLFFRSPMQYIIVAFQFIIGYFMVNIYKIQVDNNNDLLGSFNLIQLNYINQFLLGVRIATILLFSIFFMFSWSVYKKNGAYGYWIALGIDRTRFLIYCLLKFIQYSISGGIIGIILLQVSMGVEISFVNFIVMIIYISTNIVLIVGIGILLSEFVSNPSVATVIFILLNSISIFVNDNSLFNFFWVDFSSISLFSIIISFLFGVLFNFIAIYFHSKAEFNLR